jgi:hypothetical protein
MATPPVNFGVRLKRNSMNLEDLIQQSKDAAYYSHAIKQLNPQQVRLSKRLRPLLGEHARKMLHV